MIRLACVLALAGGVAAAQELPVAAAARGDFVLVPAGALGSARLDEFEMMVHPVTNTEYRKFVAATGHTVPRHWENGRIPAGMELLPVIFVNRFDAEAYANWLSRQEGRIYRLPTVKEFEYAARANQSQAVYPW